MLFLIAGKVLKKSKNVLINNKIPTRARFSFLQLNYAIG